MNRVEFVDALNCGTDLCNHFDCIMSAYNLYSYYNMDIVGYNNTSNCPSFEFEASTISQAKYLKDVISNSHIINYNKKFVFDILRNDNKLNIKLNEIKLTSG